MARKVMISCAVTGSADTPGRNPAVPVTPEQIHLFWRAYGRHDVDTDVLAYYLCERTLDDIEQFARHIMADDVTEEERHTDLHWLKVNIERPSLMPSM